MESSLVTVNWLQKNLKNPNLIILDASATSNLAGKSSEFTGLHIPNARHFDLKKAFSDRSSVFPNTLPSGYQFEAEARKLGINSTSQIVVYDNLGIYNSPRVWWMFKVMGHKDVAVLDGGLPSWIKEGFKTETTLSEASGEGSFCANFESNNVKSFDQVLANLQHNDFIVLDARSTGRFYGAAPEPREGLSSGHIPGSCNIPFEEVLNDGFMKPKSELEFIFKHLNLEKKPIIFSCGSGLTACIILLAAEIAIPNEKTLFDGSWTEWATNNSGPIEKNI
jgi:thiosulfate/3-mercaptopyruvate sulfurtransferase